MITALFGLLAGIAVIGAGGILFYRRPLHCSISFLLCSTALAGLYLLLTTQFLAVVQFAVGVCLTGVVIVISMPALDTRARENLALWFMPVGLIFFALAYWGITQGVIGEPVISSPPVWAVRGEHIPALGQELITRYLVPFTLLGLLLLVSIVSVAHLIRQGRYTQMEERRQ